MHALIVFDHRYAVSADGVALSPTHYNEDLFNRRYRSVFDTISVVGRVAGGGAGRFKIGEGIELVSAGDGKSLWGFMPWYAGIRRIVSEHVKLGSAMILISPTRNASAAYRILRKKQWPFGAEIIGDPDNALKPGNFSHPLRPLMREAGKKLQMNICRHACATAFVTRQALQRRYPPAIDQFSTSYSSIELQSEDFCSAPKPFPRQRRIKIIHIGSMAQAYKGQDTLISSIAILRRLGLEVEVTFLGEGAMMAALKSQASNDGVADLVCFAGKVSSGDQVRKHLDDADLFVLPSRTEGLPRAMIEAMARGLPCIGTPVGGIGELIGEECLVPVSSPESLAAKIRQFSSDPLLWDTQSELNIKTARTYESSILMSRRLEFYRAVYEATLTAARQRKVPQKDSVEA